MLPSIGYEVIIKKHNSHNSISRKWLHCLVTQKKKRLRSLVLTKFTGKKLLPLCTLYKNKQFYTLSLC